MSNAPLEGESVSREMLSTDDGHDDDRKEVLEDDGGERVGAPLRLELRVLHAHLVQHDRLDRLEGVEHAEDGQRTGEQQRHEPDAQQRDERAEAFHRVLCRVDDHLITAIRTAFIVRMQIFIDILAA